MTKTLIAFPDVTLYTIATKYYILLTLVKISQKTAETSGSIRLAFWVAVRRTYLFTLQEVEKICRTLQSHVMLHCTTSYWFSAQDSDEAELLPVSKNKLQFFQSWSWHKLHKISFDGDIKSFSSRHHSGLTLLTSILHE